MKIEHWKKRWRWGGRRRKSGGGFFLRVFEVISSLLNRAMRMVSDEMEERNKKKEGEAQKIIFYFTSQSTFRQLIPLSRSTFLHSAANNVDCRELLKFLIYFFLSQNTEKIIFHPPKQSRKSWVNPTFINQNFYSCGLIAPSKHVNLIFNPRSSHPHNILHFHPRSFTRPPHTRQ